MKRNATILSFDAYRVEGVEGREKTRATHDSCIVIPFPVLAKRHPKPSVACTTGGLKPRISRARNLSRLGRAERN